VLPASSMADPAFGNVVQQDGGALLRIGQALNGLVVSLISSLGELRDVGNMLEQEIAAGSPDELQGSVSVDMRPQLLLVVAGALKEMVGTLVSDIKDNAEVQRLLPAIQKCMGANQHDIFQDLAISKQSPEQDLPSCLLDLSPPRRELPVPTSRNSFATAKKSVVKGELVCTHACAHHPELVNPGVWRDLPQELMERVFGKLSLSTILQFRKSCLDWSGLIQSSNIKEACSEGHPKIFGLVVYHLLTRPYIWIHEIESEEWLRFETMPSYYGMVDDTGPFKEFLYSCDGGLVCMVPLRYSTSSPVLVYNPLTGTWKALPLLVQDFEEIVLSQLVMEGDQSSYKVILVIAVEAACAAHVYNSEAGVWSVMDSGVVYGVDDTWSFGHGYPYVFDCSTKELVDLTFCTPLARLDGVFAYSVARDRVFVLHESDDSMYLVSEYTWDSSISDLRELDVSESPVRVWPDPYRTRLLACPGVVLLFADNREERDADNCEGRDEDHHQLIGRYDLSARQWDIPTQVPSGCNISYEDLQSSFLCELRLNVSP
jgi:hypothetical protein